jgi:hypothetical protein
MKMGATMKMFHVAFAALASAGLAQDARAAVVQARSADSFVDSTGVVVKLGGGKPNSEWTTVRQKLIDSGLRNIREGYNSTTVVNRLIDLNNNGIKIVWLITPTQGTRPNSTYWITGESQFNKDNIVDFLKNRIGVNRIRAVEMNNELDVFHAQTRWYPSDTSGLSNDPNSNRYYINYLKDVTRDTSNALKADSATANMPLIGPSLTSPGAYSALGNLSTYVNHGSIHWYMAGRHPETGGWGDNGYGSYEYQKTHTGGVTAPGKPLVATEGFGNTNPAGDSPGSAWWPEDIHGRYYPRWFLKQFVGGSPISISYDFVDDGTNATNPEDNFGLLRHDLSEKPAYKAIKNLLNLLKEPNANFTPGSVDIMISGDTNGVQQCLLQKSNGTYYLCVWLDKKSWNMDSWDGPLGRRAVNAQNVTLSVPSFSGSSATYYTLDDAGNMTSNAKTISSSKTIDLAVTDRVAVVQFSTAVASGTNLVSNPSFDAENFDTQTPSGWSEAGNNINASFTESYGGSKSGARHGTHWSTGSYTAYTYQVKTGLQNGLYTLRAWAKSGGGQNTCYLEAKDFGGTARTANLPVSSTYQLVEIKDINVTNGQCTLGFWSVANGGQWAYFDDVEFFRQTTTSIPVGKRIGFKGWNNKFVSSNLNNSSYLQALWADGIGGWEQFDVVDAGGGLVAIKSVASGKYVTCDLSSSERRLRADWATGIGDWEKFSWQDLGNNIFGLKSVASNKFVSTDLNTTEKYLKGQWSDAIGDWEKFQWALAQ